MSTSQKVIEKIIIKTVKCGEIEFVIPKDFPLFSPKTTSTKRGYSSKTEKLLFITVKKLKLSKLIYYSSDYYPELKKYCRLLSNEIGIKTFQHIILNQDKICVEYESAKISGYDKAKQCLNQIQKENCKIKDELIKEKTQRGELLLNIEKLGVRNRQLEKQCKNQSSMLHNLEIFMQILWCDIDSFYADKIRREWNKFKRSEYESFSTYILDKNLLETDLSYFYKCKSLLEKRQNDIL